MGFMSPSKEDKYKVCKARLQERAPWPKVGAAEEACMLAAGEENLLMEGDAEFASESILVHEFAHSVMSVAMNEDQRQAVISAYFNARARQLYRGACDMMTCADEYWAYGTQAWFEATLRTGTTSLDTSSVLWPHSRSH